MPISRSAAKKSAVAVHDDNNEVSANDDFNTMMGKKLNEFKSSIISELTEKVLNQSKFQNIEEYKSQLEEFSSTVAIFQQHVTNLKQRNLNLQEKTRIFKKKLDRQDLEKYCEENELHGRRLCLRTKNMKKQKKNPPTKYWRQISVCLVSQTSC